MDAILTLTQNRILHGDCIQLMQSLPDGCIDMILTDPPYLVNYRDRDGRSYINDNPKDPSWILPAYTEMYRVLKDNHYLISFYGYTQAEHFISAWKQVGFTIHEHLVFEKPYASSTKRTQRRHESCYLLGKGDPPLPHIILPSVIHEWAYTGNHHHPSEKPITALIPLILAFSEPNDLILDPFTGSGTTCVAAHLLHRRYIGMEIDQTYATIASRRICGGTFTNRVHSNGNQYA
jgi:adenine-specific DNA-methyltransferase